MALVLTVCDGQKTSVIPARTVIEARMIWKEESDKRIWRSWHLVGEGWNKVGLFAASPKPEQQKASEYVAAMEREIAQCEAKLAELDDWLRNCQTPEDHEYAQQVWEPEYERLQEQIGFCYGEIAEARGRS